MAGIIWGVVIISTITEAYCVIDAIHTIIK